MRGEQQRDVLRGRGMCGHLTGHEPNVMACILEIGHDENSHETMTAPEPRLTDLDIALEVCHDLETRALRNERDEVPDDNPTNIYREQANAIRSLIAEVRAHRKARLPAEDKATLGWIAKHLVVTTMPGIRPRRDKQRAMDLLDRLLAIAEHEGE